jgi:hypothetical protein
LYRPLHGVEDIRDSNDEQRDSLLRDYYHSRSEAFRMIAEDSGIAQINKLFKSINRPALNGPIIERIRELRHLQLKK